MKSMTNEAIHVYNFNGINGKCSVCAPNEMDEREVCRDVQKMGLMEPGKTWMYPSVSFSGGEPNPCPCNEHPETRRHWLLWT